MNNNLTLSVTLRGDGRQLTGTLRNAQGEVREFGDVSVRDNARATGAFERTERSVGTVNNQLNEMNRVGQLARNALLAVGGAISVREVIGYSDAWRNAENQLRQVTDTSTELAYIQGQLVDIALETRSNFGASANLYARLARATTDLNLTQRELLGLTTTINQSFATNGATAQEAAAAITQLSQGLAAGALRGDEFNSVSEQAPGIMRAIADSLNMTIAELREFAAQGGITAEIVVNALQRASDTIDQDFGKTVATFGQSLEVARTNLTAWVGTSDEVSTAVDTLGGGIVTVSKHLDQLVTIAQAGAVLFAGRYVGAIAASQGALAAKAAVAATATGAINVLTGATTRQAAAATTMAAANRAGVAALALVGGPAGAAVIAGAGLYYFREELGLTDDKMQGTIDTVGDLGESFVDEFRNLGTSVMGAVRGARAELIELDAGFLDTKATALDSFSGIVDSSADVINMGLIPLQNGLNLLDQTFAGLINRTASALESAGALPMGMGNLFGEQITRLRSMADGLNEGLIEPIGISTVALEGNAQAWREQADAMRVTADEVRTGTNPATQETVGIFQTLDEWLFQTTKSAGDNTKANSDNAESQRELAAATQAHADALEELYNRLRPGRREVVQLADDMRTLTLAIATGTGNIAQNIQAMGLLQQQFIEAQNDTDDLADKTVKAAFTMEGAWDEVRLNGLRRLDDGFADLWEGAVDGSINAGKLMKRALAQTISEMAHMAFTRPITVQFATSMGFGGTGAGGQQAGGGFNMGSVSSLKNGWDAVQGGFNGIQWGGASTSYSGGFAGSATAGMNTVGGSSYLGGSMQNFQGMQGLAGAGAGFAGSFAAGSVFGKSAEQEIGSTLGAIAGTYLGGPIGSAIGSFLGGGLGSLFGSEPTKFSGRFGTTASLDRSEGAGKDGVFEHQADGRFYRETALGYAGFRDQGTERLQRAGVGEDKQWAEDLVNATAAMDALTVSVARSDQEIATMRDTVQGLEASGRNAGEIIEFALKGRALAALESIGYTFSDAVSSLPADEFTARLEVMAGGMGVLMQSANRLNLQFDATAAGALEAAGNLASRMGGVDALLQAQQSYYQAFYTEEERLANLTEDLTAQFSAMGMELPDTRQGVRDVVESLKVMDAAGQEQLATIYQNVPALREYINAMDEQRAAAAESGEAIDDNAESMRAQADIARERAGLERELLQLQGNTEELRRRELASIDESNRALQQRIWSIKDEAAAQAALAAQQQLESSLALYSSGIVSATDNALDVYNETLAVSNELAQSRKAQLQAEQQAVESLSQLYDSLMLSNQSILDPAERLREAQEQYARLSVRAESGDTEAASKLQGASSTYLDAAASYYGQSSSQYAAIFGDVTDGVQDLERQFGRSLDTLGSIESIEQRALREQERARELLMGSLSEQVRQSDLLGSIADLIDVLPSSLASAIESILPEFADNSGSGGAGGGFDVAAYLANKTAQVNAIGQDGNTNWSINDVIERMAQDGMTPAQHYEKYGRDEGILPYYNGSHANGLWNVPFDGYIAQLHKGELVAPADTAEQLRELPTRRLPMPNLSPISLPGSATNRAANMPAPINLEPLTRELSALRLEVAQLRSERRRDAEQAAGQRSAQVREQQKTNRNTKTRAPTL